MAMLLAMVMVLGMTVTASAAITTGTSIKVQGLSKVGKQSVYIYNIFKLDENDNNWVKADWVPQHIKADETLTNELSLATLVEAKNSTEADDMKETTTGTVEFTDRIEAGAYLVIAVDEENKVTYNPMIAVTYKYNEQNILVGDAAVVTAKADTYTTEKNQKDDDQVVEVGDLLEYEVKVTVPYFAEDAESKTLTVTDTVTGGTYFLTGSQKGKDAVNKVFVDGVENENFKISEDAHGLTTFTIDFSDLVKDNTYAGSQITIKYTVKVDAVDSVTNKAEASNTPNVEVNQKTYTGNAQITKYAMDEDNNNLENNPKLAGAEFALYRNTNDGNREYAVIDKNGYVTGEWTKIVAKEDGTFERPENVSTVTTNDEGLAVVYGLNIGTYYFDEVVAPDGYSINEDDKEVVVEKKGTEEENSVTVTGATNMIDTKLSSLPSTGGIGTTIFTIGGCAIMIAAAGLFFASRRKANK